MSNDLDERRHQAADKEFADYEFGDSGLGEVDGWESTLPGAEFTRTLWFINSEDPEGDDIKGHFVVQFAAIDSAEVEHAYASINGNDIGCRAKQEPAAPAL